MEISVNGKREQVGERVRVTDLLAQFRLNPSSVIIELNRSVVKREAYAETSLNESDEVEIVQFVGGGSGAQHP